MNQHAIDGGKILALFIYGAILFVFGGVCGALAVFEWTDLPPIPKPLPKTGGIPKS